MHEAMQHQLKQGAKSAVRIAAATGLGGPALGGVVLLLETGRALLTALAGKDGTRVGDVAIGPIETAIGAARRLTK